jgi:hypothetical protein
MRISLATRVARACVATTLVLSLALAPSYAGMGGVGGASSARPAFGTGHFRHFASPGFNRRFDFDRFGFHRFGSNRFDRFGANRFGRFGFNRFGFNRFGGGQLFVGGWGGWGWDGWGGAAVSSGASEPIIVGDGAPVIINIGADPEPGGAGAGYGGGCVTHKLIYDSAGKYVGERQTSQC